MSKHYAEVFEGLLHIAHRHDGTEIFCEGWLYQWIHSTEEGRLAMEEEMITLPQCKEGCRDE